MAEPTPTPLKFSMPERYYESSACFENEKGQGFIISVKGDEQDTVEQCTANLSAYLEVTPDESMEFSQAASVVTVGESEQPLSSEGTLLQEETIEPGSTHIIEIAFQVDRIEDIKEPLRLNFRLGDMFSVPIDGGGQQITKRFDLGTRPVVWVKVSKGKVNFVLVQETGVKTFLLDSKTVETSQDITYLKTPDRVNPGTRFYVRVTGIDPVNEYEIGGTLPIAVSRADITPVTPVR